jgi:hypothetical protein
MGYRRALIRLLDRPGARGVLTAIINLQARRSAPGVRVYNQRGMWMHQESGVIYIDSPTMDYHPAIFPTWENELNRAIANARAKTPWCFPERWDPRGKSFPSKPTPSRFAASVCSAS